jgi:hypothetical protein
MGIRGEVFSTKVILQNRTYFFNVKENRMGDLYLNIVESKNRDAGGFERQSVILFAEDLQDFLKGFDDSLRVLEKAVRERKKSGYRRDRPGEDYGEGRRGDRENRGAQGGYDEGRGDRDARGRDGEDRGDGGAYGRDREGRGERGLGSGYGEDRHGRAAFGSHGEGRGPRSRGGYGEDRGDSSSYSRGSEDRTRFRRDGGGEAERRGKDPGGYPPKDGIPARKPRRLVAKKRED